jgi:ElaB/YqjD/DUF883 family membrane-anchored ribosome-binding protein
MIRTRFATAQDELRNTVSDVDDMLGDAAERGRYGVREMQDRALRAFDDAKERLAATRDEVRRLSRNAAEATDEYVHDQPWRALGLGAAAGVVLGLAVGMLIVTASRRR